MAIYVSVGLVLVVVVAAAETLAERVGGGDSDSKSCFICGIRLTMWTFLYLTKHVFTNDHTINAA